MPKPVRRVETEDVDRAGGNRNLDVPESPEDFVEQPLKQFQAATLPIKKPFNFWWLGGIVAAIVVIMPVAGMLLLMSEPGVNKPGASSQIPTVTPVTPAPPTGSVTEVNTAKALPVSTAPKEQATSTPQPATLTALTEPPSSLFQLPTTPSLGTHSQAQPSPTLTIDDAPPNPRPPVRNPPLKSPPATKLPLPTLTPTQKVIQSSATLTLAGTIKTLDNAGFTLNTNPERVLVIATTRIVTNQPQLPVPPLAAGQYVNVQALRNAQGQLVAQVVTVVLKLPPRLPPGG